eukprot:scaffold7968_cov240-Ochromonas_danica.AAC.7
MEDRSIWLALQLCDSAFPGGTLANSQGVESAHQHGLIQRGDTTSLTRFLQLSLEQVGKENDMIKHPTYGDDERCMH